MVYRADTAAALTEEQYKQIEARVLVTAQRTTIGARLLPTFPLVSEGVTELGWDELEEMQEAVIDMAGETENDDVVGFNRKTVKVPVIEKKFSLSWRDLTASRSPAEGGFNRPLDLTNAEAATRRVILAEDDLIFNGNTKLKIDGLLSHASRQTLNGNAWTTSGNAYDDIVKALEKLTDKNFYGPYVGVFNPKAFAYLYKVFTSTGIPQLEQIRPLLTGGIFVSAAVPAHEALIMQTGAEIADRASATDAPRVMVNPTLTRQQFMVYQITVPRVKQASGIVHIQSVDA